MNMKLIEKRRALVNAALKEKKTADILFEKKCGTLREMMIRPPVKVHAKGGKCTTAHKPNIYLVTEVKRQPNGQFAEQPYKSFDLERLVSVNGMKV